MVKAIFSGGTLAGSAFRTVDVSDQSGIVLDASFLFSAEFLRLGDDLLLRGADGAEVLLRDYFAQHPPPPVETAEGARLTPGIVESLAGPELPLSYAQAGDAQVSDGQAGDGQLSGPIGDVSSLNGIARVQRADGTRADLHEGDPVFQGDVVSTGVGSELGILFVDDTVFSLSANARMVINELIYNPSSTANSMGVSLIQGTFVFVTGKVAPSGEMDVATPVGTIGIRGTTVGVRIATFGGTTRIANLEHPETGEIGSFTFSNFGGSAQFTQASHFLEVRSASVDPGVPSLIPSQAINDAFGRDLSSAIEIQRSIEQDRTDQPQTAPEGTDQQGELIQEQTDALLSQLPLQTAAGGDQPLGEGSSFAAGLGISGPEVLSGLGASGIVPTGTLGGVETSGFGLATFEDRAPFNVVALVGDVPEGEPPPINVVYLIDISGSMSRGRDGGPPPPSGLSRLDLAKLAVLALNQQFTDADLADRVTIKVFPFHSDTDKSVIDAKSAEFDRADDSGLDSFVAGLLARDGTQYEAPLQVAADWLREDVDPGAGITERHEESQNFIFFFSDGGETYLPPASLIADLYDNGSGTPNISTLTIEAFGFGEPGAANFSVDQLGKVETGSLGNGDAVTIIADASDIEEVFSITSSSGQPSGEDPGAADVLQLADLLDDPDLDVDSLNLADSLVTDNPVVGPAESGDTVITVQSTGTYLAVMDGISVADVTLETITSLVQT